MKKQPNKKPFYLHWYRVDPFGRIVFCVVGDPLAAIKHARKHHFRKYDFGKITEVIQSCESCDPFIGNLEECGRTIYRPGGDSLIYFPVFPRPGTLVHELYHATRQIISAVGVADANGETDAYIIGDMFDHFFSVLEKDKREM